MRTKADSPTRNCTEDGCTRPLRARGLCASHYNQTHQPNRHAARVTNCTVCGATITRPHKSDRRPTCSPACRHALAGQAYAGGRASDTAMRSRARDAGAHTIEDFTSVEIFNRDNWTCYICADPVNKAPNCFDPRSATVDHVIPLSKGGQHTRDNVKCACLRCNSSKQDRVPA